VVEVPVSMLVIACKAHILVIACETHMLVIACETLSTAFPTVAEEKNRKTGRLWCQFFGDVLIVSFSFVF